MALNLGQNMKRKFFGRIVGCLLVVAAVSSCSNENTGFKHIAPPTVSVVEVSNIYFEPFPACRGSINC